LGCAEEGRSNDHWVDFNFFGHQLVIHVQPQPKPIGKGKPVDGKDVQFLILELYWNGMYFRNFQKNLKGIILSFVVGTYIRFEGGRNRGASNYVL
jgi:extradiol dioxygenase family protein